ncbi:hypothetical protein J5289_21690 [Rhizobium sp. B230/85]|uniref:hypothetical protein n=1 Tax=unclassified Rhizobium TaxID=2613769 RepID=UPI001ADC87EA|nr:MULTISPECIES: hypothetical protein [unclassified Rhizobium]MBO9136899.1 hypothetical protein [Rhizobium sp. B209b/85]QXZ97937.1 hypothetical protein J5289_21690 [Rhizobium sp. B230/85]
MPTFTDFKYGPANKICRKAGLNIDQCATFGEYTEAFQALDRKIGHKLGDFFLTLPASTGETAVIQAILHAADYSRFADQMTPGDVWQRFQYVSGEHAETVAAAILRQNR